MAEVTTEIKGFEVKFFWCKNSGVSHSRHCPRCHTKLDGKGNWKYDIFDKDLYIICLGCGQRFLYNDRISDEYQDEVHRIERALKNALAQNQNLNEKGARTVIARVRVSALSAT